MERDTSTILNAAAHEAAHATLGLLFEIPVYRVDIDRKKLTGLTDCRTGTWLEAKNNPLSVDRRAVQAALEISAGLAVELEMPETDMKHAMGAAGFGRVPIGDAAQFMVAAQALELGDFKFTPENHHEHVDRAVRQGV